MNKGRILLETWKGGRYCSKYLYDMVATCGMRKVKWSYRGENSSWPMVFPTMLTPALQGATKTHVTVEDDVIIFVFMQENYVF
jgi:hypothetical protein